MMSYPQKAKVRQKFPQIFLNVCLCLTLLSVFSCDKSEDDPSAASQDEETQELFIEQFKESFKGLNYTLEFEGSDEATVTLPYGTDISEVKAKVQKIITSKDVYKNIKWKYSGNKFVITESTKDGKKSATFTVNVKFEKGSDAASIKSFVLEASKNDQLDEDAVGVIVGKDITVYIPKGTDKANLKATIQHNGESISSIKDNKVGDGQYLVTKGDIEMIYTLYIVYDEKIEDADTFLTDNMEDIAMSSDGMIVKTGQNWSYIVSAANRFPERRIGNGADVTDDKVTRSLNDLVSDIKGAYNQLNSKALKGQRVSDAKGTIIEMIKSLTIDIEPYEEAGASYARFKYQMVQGTDKAILITLKGSY